MLQRAPGVRLLPLQAHLLPHLPRPAGEYPQSGDGEGCLERQVPVQTLGLRMLRLAGLYGKDGARGDVRVPALPVSVPGRQLQVAGPAGPSHAASDDVAQEHHDAAGRGYRVPGHRHKPARRR